MKMTSQDLNPLYQQLSDVLRALTSLSNTIELRHAQAETLHDMMRTDVANLRQDQRDIDEKLDCVIAVMQHDLEQLRTNASHSAASVKDLLVAVNTLSKPVSEIMALRSRIAGMVIGLGVLGSTLMWLTEPIYRWFVENHVLKR